MTDELRALLTPRQLEVARLVAEGRSTKQVAACLGISTFTAKEHIRQAASRLGGCGHAPPRHRLALWYISLREVA